MARLDPSRTALELSDAELATIGLLLTAPDDPALAAPETASIVDELERAGVVVDGAIGGYAARMLAVIGEPQLRVMVERFAAGAPRADFAAVRDELGVWAETTGDGTTEFTPIEPALVPWAVARAVNLGPRAENGWGGTLELRGGALQLALERLDEQDVEGADRELERTTSLDETERKVLCKLLLERRLSWRAFSVWENAEGEPQARSVAVIDGGESGFWLSQHEEPATDDSLVRLGAATAGAVWERIVELVPLPVGSTVPGPDG